MLIGIDGNEANIKDRVGVNQYAFEILKGLHKILENEPEKHRVIVFLKNLPLSDLPKENNFWKYKIIPGKKLWVLTKLTPYLLVTSKKPDIFFSPSHYVPPISTIPRVCSIMDLGFLKFSGQFKKSDFWQLKYWTAISITVSKSIIAISNATKKDIVRHYPRASNKIEVTHLGYDKDRFNARVSKEDVRRVKNRYSIVNDYILFLSTLKPSKNVEGAIAAFRQILDNHMSTMPDYQLVIAGKKGWLYEPIFRKVKRLGLDKNVIFTDYVHESDKPALMAGAKVFVAPSFWEGFGLQVLEAMAVGTPVVVSKVGSLPEIVGQAGIVVDPHDAKDIARGISRVLSMKNEEYNRLSVMCVTQANKFSWEKTARKTLEVLERA